MPKQLRKALARLERSLSCLLVSPLTSNELLLGARPHHQLRPRVHALRGQLGLLLLQRRGASPPARSRQPAAASPTSGFYFSLTGATLGMAGEGEGEGEKGVPSLSVAWCVRV